ncbi:MAG: OmpA family protein [Salaquimonas sp.]|jgi:outer membrane protein OmpA-like peptidoglycan-associated protein|nr:OmpA family protein [Salaquimonas sp.]
MNIRRHICFLAVLGLAAPITLAAPHQASAQQFITQQQIIHKLRRRPVNVMPGQQQLMLQQDQRLKLRHRAPQPNVQVLRRAPQPTQPGTAMMRVPGPVDHSGDIAVRRAPPSQHGTVAELRAPPPQDFGAQEFRAPPPQGQAQQFRAPGPKKSPGAVQVASTSGRGLDVRPAGGNETVGTNYPDNARVDLEILFDYDSDRIDPGSVKQLIVLGEALNDQSLAGSRIVVAGHTDAAGSDAYNENLSLRRARAVYDFLVNYAGVNADRLIPEGYGERLLKFPDAPQSGQNRRVEIINLGEAG